MGLGIVLFRNYCTELSTEAFGFWAFLWAVFGCGILIDFGFGLAVQKGVAQHAARHEWEPINCLVSNAFFLFSLIGVVLALAGWCLARDIARLICGDGMREEYVVVLRIFFIGMGISIPTAIFQEVLKGLQEIPALNKIMMIASGVNFGIQMWLLKNDGGMNLLVVSSVVVILGQSIFAAWYAFRRYPRLKLGHHWISLNAILDAGRFGMSGYFILLSYMVVTRTDQLLLGSFVGLSAVAAYQPALKLGELFGILTRQISECLQPAAAYYNSLGLKDKIQTLLLNGLKWSALMASPVFIFCLFKIEWILQSITGLETIHSDTMIASIILLIWAYSFVLTHNVFKRIMVMTGREKSLVTLGLQEAAFNVILSLVCMKVFGGPVGVASGTLIASLVFGWGPLWQWACEELETSSWSLIRQTITPSILCQIPGAILLICFNQIELSLPFPSLVRGLLAALTFAVPYFIMVWKFVLAGNEKDLIRARFPAARLRHPIPTLKADPLDLKSTS